MSWLLALITVSGLLFASVVAEDAVGDFERMTDLSEAEEAGKFLATEVSRWTANTWRMDEVLYAEQRVVQGTQYRIVVSVVGTGKQIHQGVVTQNLDETWTMNDHSIPGTLALSFDSDTARSLVNSTLAHINKEENSKVMLLDKVYDYVATEYNFLQAQTASFDGVGVIQQYYISIRVRDSTDETARDQYRHATVVVGRNGTEFTQQERFFPLGDNPEVDKDFIGGVFGGLVVLSIVTIGIHLAVSYPIKKKKKSEELEKRKRVEAAKQSLRRSSTGASGPRPLRR